jgi:hypothetical protein
LFIRGIIGFFESASFPAVFHFFPTWVPIAEKTLMIPAIASGMYMGEILGFSLSGYLVESTLMINGYDYGGWPSVFYVFGCVGILWFPYWAWYSYETPGHHPKITSEELAFINQGKAFASLRPHHPTNSNNNSDNSIQEHLLASPPMKSSTSNSITTGQSPLVEYNQSSPMIETTTNPLTYQQTVPPTLERTISIGADGVGPMYITNHSITSINEDCITPNSIVSEYEPVKLYDAEDHDITLTDPSQSTTNTTMNTMNTTPSDNNYHQSQHHQQSHHHISDPQRTVNLIIEDKEELALRTPWKAFFTHPVALTLFINSWTNVSIVYISILYIVYNTTVYIEYRVGLALHYSQKCHHI